MRGVYWHESHRKWVANGREYGRLVMLGEFDTLEEARQAREHFVWKTYGMAALDLSRG